MGAYTVFYFFDGETVTTKGSIYNPLSFNEYEVNATPEEIYSDSLKVLNQLEDGYCYNKYADNRNGANTFIGCVVSLKRSRKAPNGKPLKVLEYNDRFYNGSYWIDSSIDLIDSETGLTYTNISVNCITEVITGVKEIPFWFLSKNEYDNIIKKTKEDKKALIKDKEEVLKVLIDIRKLMSEKDLLLVDDRIVLIRNELISLKS